MNYGIQEWIRSREQERDKNDLAFRPFLKWFDRNAEELVLEAGRKVRYGCSEEIKLKLKLNTAFQFQFAALPKID